jgi:hypothetical protein
LSFHSAAAAGVKNKMQNFTSENFSRIRGIPGAATQRVETIILLARSLVYQSVLFVLASGLLFVISTFIYGSFYFAFVPSPIHQGPVHLFIKITNFCLRHWIGMTIIKHPPRRPGNFFD